MSFYQNRLDTNGYLREGEDLLEDNWINRGEGGGKRL